MNAYWLLRSLCSVLVALSVFAMQLKPAEKMSPHTHAQKIYQVLVERKGRSQPRDPRTLSGFPEAPTEVAQQLEALAASKQGEERDALLELAQALRRTGLYCQVLFRAKPGDVIVKYKALARTDAQTAHAGWNNLPIGLYEVWAERNGKAVSEANEYDILQRKIVIDLVIK